MGDKGQRLGIAVGIITCRGQIWIQKRGDGQALAGLWEFPGGKIRAGEKPEEGLSRELKEEVGAALEPASLLLVQDWDYPHAAVRLYFYHCPVSKKQSLTPAAGRWVQLTELGAYRFPPANKKLLDLLSSETLAQADHQEDDDEPD